MILAAADYAEGREGVSPPPELQLAWNCKTWGALPNGGGLLDQPAGLVERMTAALNAYDTIRSMKAAANIAVWQRSHPEMARIYARISELRKASGR